MSHQSPADPVAAASDPELLVAALNDRYRGRLLLFAARRLRGDRSAAEDVVQEAFRTVLELLRAGRVRDPESLPAFAFETVRNLCMHQGRTAGREGNKLERLAEMPSTSPEDILTGVINEERRRTVREALDRLDADDRRVLHMTYVDGLTSESIGRQLGLTAVAVRVRRHRALRRLSKQLGVTFVSEREQES